MNQWIDFRALRGRLSFASVFRHYKVAYTLRGEQALAVCPLPTHAGARQPGSFSANVKRGVWQCFGCRAKGNILDFAVRMEGLSPNNTGDVRTTALRLNHAFKLGCVRNRGTPTTAQRQHEGTPLFDHGASATAPAPPRTPEVIVNEPLDFALKGLDPEHPCLRDRGIAPQTARHFGIGYCSRGYFAGRIAVPIHDGQGRLVGYAGRIIDDSKVDAEHPKYTFPAQRERNGVVLAFDRSLLVYNLHRLQPTADTIVVVQDVESVWWLDQAGVPNTVAFMRADCTKDQGAEIATRMDPATRVCILPTGDRDGELFAERVFAMLGRKHWIRWIEVPSGMHPTDIMPSDLFGRLQV